MMSCDLAIVDDRLEIRFGNRSKPKVFADCRNECIGGLFHIVRQVLRIGTGIGDQFLLIEGLHIVEGLLCRVAELFVCFTLQRGQVEKLWSRYALDLFLHIGYGCGLAAAGRSQHIRCMLLIDSRTACLESHIQFHREILLLDEICNIIVTLHDHGKGRCLHSAGVQMCVVSY